MTAETRSRFLDLPALAALAHMRFSTRQRIEGAYSGRHPSRQQGGAGEFVDYREYVGGEDLRRLDWKVFARTGKAFVRLHQDETNVLCTLAIDGSGSMAFGANRGEVRSKLQFVQFLATALAHVITQGQDQVGLAILDDTLRSFMPPGGTRTHVTALHQAIETLATQPTSIMATALRRLFERSSRRGVLMLMSDFLMHDSADVFAALRLFRHSGWEVVVLHVVHPDEENLPDGAAYRFDGMENDGHLACSPNEIRTAYQERFRTHLAVVRQFALASGCEYRLVSTAVSYLQILQSFLVERAG